MYICYFVVAGYRKLIQRPQSCAAAAVRTSGAQAGPVLGVRCCHADLTAMLLHAGGPLARLHLVLDRQLGPHQRGRVRLAVQVTHTHTQTLLPSFIFVGFN